MAVWLEPSSNGEVRVETGTGLIDELVHKPAARNAQLKIKATHQDLRDPVTGWVDTADSAVWPLAQEAAAARFEVEYRIEVKRKPDVDPGKPITELGNREKVRDVAALARKAELSPLDTTPPTTTPIADTAPADAEPPAELDQVPDDEAPPATVEQHRRRPRVEEGKPWELYNSDRSLNLGSYSYQGVVETVEWAHALSVAHDRDLAAAGSAPPEFSLRKVETLAKTLLEIADQVQAATRADGHVDRMDGSHRRARYAVRSAVELHPIPWGADADTRKAWADRLAEHATGILHASLTLFRFHETGEAR